MTATAPSPGSVASSRRPGFLSRSQRWLEQHPRTMLITNLAGSVLGVLVMVVTLIIVIVAAGMIIGLTSAVLILTPLMVEVIPEPLMTGELLASVFTPYAITGGVVGLIVALVMLFRRIDRHPVRPRAERARRVTQLAVVQHGLGNQIHQLQIGALGSEHLSTRGFGFPRNATLVDNEQLVLAIAAELDDNGRFFPGGDLATHRIADDATLQRINEIAQRVVTRTALAHPEQTVDPAVRGVASVIATATLSASRLLQAVPLETRQRIEAELVRGGQVSGRRFAELLIQNTRSPAD